MRRFSRLPLRLERLEGRVLPTFTVLNANDSGPGSLRQAVVSANGTPGPDDIAFDSTFFNIANPRTINLFAASGQLTITQDLVINGPGAAIVTVNGGGSVRLFNVDDGQLAARINVTLRAMTVTGGNGTNDGIVAGDGGGIRTTNENLTLDNMVVTGNSTIDFRNGGGVTATTTAFITIRNSTISGNTAHHGGGVYFFNGGGLLLENSTVSGNTATASDADYGRGGGGLYFFGTVAAGGFTIRNSTIAGNTSGRSGGGMMLRNLVGTARIQNSTITGNASNTTDTTSGYGGGGIAIAGTSNDSVLSIESSIISGNTASAANGRSDIAAIAAATVTLNFCAVGDPDGFAFTGANNRPFGTPLNLLTLANYGGPTQTVALGVGSAAENLGSNPALLSTDQRGPGFPRVLGNVADIGAFEGVIEFPNVTGGVANVTVAGGATHIFELTYFGATPINVATLDNNDIRVTGANGFNQLAEFVSVTPSGNGSPRTATYRITAPGGTFGVEDNGLYTFSVQAGQVANTNGVTVPPASGTFRVAIVQTLTVTNLNDSGPGSLRQAILSANASTFTSDTIVFQSGLTGGIDLNQSVGQLTITDSVTIAGPGVAAITVRGLGVRVFNIENATEEIDVTISGLHVNSGNGSSGGPTPVFDNGGGIRVSGERLTLNGMLVAGNVVPGANVGGGIAAFFGAFLSIRNSTISGNSASRGGGIFIRDSGLLMENSTISGNTAIQTPAAGFGGGGLYLANGVTAGGFTIRNSTIADNTTSSSGGGLWVFNPGGAVLIQNSTITGNTANTTSTLAGYGGGGIALFGSGADILSLESTIVSGNTASAANGRSDIAANGASIVNANFCAVGDADGFTPSGASGNNLPFGAVLELGTLGFNGGTTQSIAMAGNSPLVNAGSNPANLTTDQRGPAFPRVVGSAADIGAFEVGPLVVSNLNDGGPGSLREAIFIANAAPGFAETITFQAGLTGTIALTLPLFIADHVTIAGPGAAALSVSGGNASRVFDITDNNAVAVIAVTIAGLTITGGSSSSNGGGIRVTNENLTLDGVVVTGNRTTGGAGGGGIAINNTGSLTVRNSTISGNAAESSSVDARGGGIFFLNGGTLLVENSTVSGNTAGSTHGGGGIFFYAPALNSSVTIRNSTIAGNTAPSGGGISLRGVPGSNPVFVVQNSTITGNASLTTSTTPGYGGGGIAVPANVLFAASISVVSTIVSGNTATAANGRGDIAFPNSTPIPISFSAIGDADGFTASGLGSNNLPFGAVLGLGGLANNGGPTQTIAMAANSPLVNAGSNPANLTTDQRGAGFVRDSGGVDIGAFELQPVAPPQVASAVVNGGQVNLTQRSRVTSLGVTFSTQVTFAGAVASAFTLTRNGGGTVNFTATASIVGGVTVVTLNGFTGAETNSGSLRDGRYTLTALASQISAGGQQMAANFTFGDAQGLFRFYGDMNADRRVDISDFGFFSLAFLNQANFNPALDFNNDGRIDIADFGQFSVRFFTTLP